jgi:hypothetical protein
MHKWPHKTPHLSKQQISAAVKNAGWQSFRRSLKGVPTSAKLDALHKYLTESPPPLLKNPSPIFTAVTIPNVKFIVWQEKYLREWRVANYINALKRGGLLNNEGEVMR